MNLSASYSNHKSLEQIVKFKESLKSANKTQASNKVSGNTSINEYGEAEVFHYRQKQRILSEKERAEISKRY